jgi:hypothetical protein
MRATEYLIELLLTLILGLILINLAYHARRLARKHALLDRLRRKR